MAGPTDRRADDALNRCSSRRAFAQCEEYKQLAKYRSSDSNILSATNHKIRNSVEGMTGLQSQIVFSSAD